MFFFKVELQGIFNTMKILRWFLQCPSLKEFMNHNLNECRRRYAYLCESA